jgi:hypothetical protein
VPPHPETPHKANQTEDQEPDLDQEGPKVECPDKSMLRTFRFRIPTNPDL